MGVKTAKNHPQTPPVTLSVTSSPETYDYHENDNVSFPLSLANNFIDLTLQIGTEMFIILDLWEGSSLYIKRVTKEAYE